MRKSDIKKIMPKRANKVKICSPEACDHCMYIGEGDFICDKDMGEDDVIEGVFVIENFEPTNMYLYCQKGR